MTPFTLVMAYYENAGMLDKQIDAWAKLPDEIRSHLHVRIVDDGSPRAPARKNAIRATGLVGPGGIASFELYRVGVDVAWNQDACRNIGVRHAASQWLLLTDMDHVVPEATWRRLMFSHLNKATVYRFARVSAPDMAPYKHHPNSWALTAKMYWRIGGYDETLAGNYGTDGDFLVRARGLTQIVELPQHLIRVPREVVPDASTTTLQRKLPEQKDNIRRLIAARREGWKPLLFSFPYEREL